MKWTAKQLAALQLFQSHSVTLLYGGSRSGKTYFTVRQIIERALAAPGSDHLIVRKTFKDCRRSIFNKTLKDALKDRSKELAASGVAFKDGVHYKRNKTDSFVEFTNGSRIFCEGLDEDRIESILGNEYATIFYNEVSEIAFSVRETISTRLAQVVDWVLSVDGKPETGQLRKLEFMDCNPPKKSHWVYRVFFDKVNPEDGSPLPDPDQYAAVQINPIDNVDHLGEDYLKMLSGLSRAKRKRFLEGEWGDDTEGALWKSAWINDHRAKWDHENHRWLTPEITRMIVAIDPSVTAKATSDEVGIVAVGKAVLKDDNGVSTEHFYLFDDESAIMDAASWGRVAVELFDRREADRIVGEVNQGGDLVELNIRNVRRNIPFSQVRATRGKAVRAEPVAALYEKGQVHHVGEFPDLEDELTTWVPPEKPSDTAGQRSPNRLDALVWGITELMTQGTGDHHVPEEVLAVQIPL